MLVIGTDIQLTKIIIETYKEKILKISVLALPKYSYKLRNVLIAAYGVWSFKPNKFRDSYIWLSPTGQVELFFNGESSNKWCFATFKDLELDSEKVKADKEKTQRAADGI